MIGWALSLATLATVMIVNNEFQAKDIGYSPFAYGLHDGLSRAIWAIALSYILFACTHDMGGPINWFLSHSLWQPLARISFATYIVHHSIVILMVGTMKTPPTMNETTFIGLAILVYILSIFVAVLGTLAFESPIIHLEKYFFDTHLKIKSPIVVDGEKPNPVCHVHDQKYSEKKII